MEWLQGGGWISDLCVWPYDVAAVDIRRVLEAASVRYPEILGWLECASFARFSRSRVFWQQWCSCGVVACQAVNSRGDALPGHRLLDATKEPPSYLLI